MCQYDTDAPAQGHPLSHASILQKLTLKKPVTRITEILEYYRNTGIPVKNIGRPVKDTY